MQSAPAVTYPVGRSYVHCLLAAALLLAAAVAIGFWCFKTEHPGWRQAIGAGAWLACLALAWYGTQWPRKGVLRWDGQNWSWESGATALGGTIRPHLDWQSGVLLEFRAPAHRTLWLWPARSAEPGRWDALRRAVWARGDADGAPRTVGPQ